ncbi:hypothetical protein ERHA54_00870 [Erwinia rhapontici]|nr:hypothetical protein ERHA54_00870 [Erwinia rhapontici]BCQ42555.1 hypothetical protein ERHA55_00820 [Erwinia rhapontici]
MNSEPESLTQGWAAIARSCQDARGWVETVRVGSRRLDNEADKLNLSLLRTRNLANNLQHVASTPMTVGFFGISQAGKSYLISALAAGSHGSLKAAYGDRRVDFIKEVNPVGGVRRPRAWSRALPDRHQKHLRVTLSRCVCLAKSILPKS